VSAASCARRSRSPSAQSEICQQEQLPPPNRHCLLVPSLPQPPAPRAGGSPKAPAPAKPRVERSSPALFSADSQHTRRSDGVWWFCWPWALFSALAHSTSSIIGPLPVFTCYLFPVCSELRAHVSSPIQGPSPFCALAQEYGGTNWNLRGFLRTGWLVAMTHRRLVGNSTSPWPSCR
jgi:hypothetical protein